MSVVSVKKKVRCPLCSSKMSAYDYHGVKICYCLHCYFEFVIKRQNGEEVLYVKSWLEEKKEVLE